LKIYVQFKRYLDNAVEVSLVWHLIQLRSIIASDGHLLFIG